LYSLSIFLCFEKHEILEFCLCC